MVKIFRFAIIALLIYGLLNLFKVEPARQNKVPQVPQQKTVATPTPTPDTRISTVRIFFERYNSQLSEDAPTFVAVADSYKIDYRILPAIAMVESTGGKFTPSCAPYNIFGWTSNTSPCGFYRFSNYREAINHVAEKITSERAYANFQSTRKVPELAKTYNVRPDDWTNKVGYFMERIK